MLNRGQGVGPERWGCVVNWKWIPTSFHYANIFLIDVTSHDGLRYTRSNESWMRPKTNLTYPGSYSSMFHSCFNTHQRECIETGAISSFCIDQHSKVVNAMVTNAFSPKSYLLSQGRVDWSYALLTDAQEVLHHEVCAGLSYFVLWPHSLLMWINMSRPRLRL